MCERGFRLVKIRNPRILHFVDEETVDVRPQPVDVAVLIVAAGRDEQFVRMVVPRRKRPPRYVLEITESALQAADQLRQFAFQVPYFASGGVARQIVFRARSRRTNPAIGVDDSPIANRGCLPRPRASTGCRPIGRESTPPGCRRNRNREWRRRHESGHQRVSHSHAAGGSTSCKRFIRRNRSIRSGPQFGHSASDSRSHRSTNTRPHRMRIPPPAPVRLTAGLGGANWPSRCNCSMMPLPARVRNDGTAPRRPARTRTPATAAPTPRLRLPPETAAAAARTPARRCPPAIETQRHAENHPASSAYSVPAARRGAPSPAPAQFPVSPARSVPKPHARGVAELAVVFDDDRVEPRTSSAMAA